MAPWSVLDTPMAKIHQHLCAFHVVADQHGRQIQSHHYCSCISDFHQCTIYDSDLPNARLIGIEYLISEDKFNSLPTEEKQYWHSHKYEVESGVLIQMHASGIEDDDSEYMTGTLIKNPDLPLGAPSLMMSYTNPEMVDWELVKKRDQEYDVNTIERSKARSTYLDLKYPKNEEADQWMKSGGQPVQFVPAVQCSSLGNSNGNGKEASSNGNSS
ncbi:hypothetical protein PSTT_06129 [Puccinia striiformis]|uniref:DUF1264 domain-containing protein n=1 Tax=Puccinia striiformis TaxID=27350 RepID=A0A2S4VL49_9BASI|nr:hypothetical protein PSTT_06129 [Puccinia striiformis]